MSESNRSEPRRGRKRLDKADVPTSFLPDGNPSARTAYLCAIFGMIPVAGIVLGMAAMIYGWLGYKFASGTEAKKGIGHSIVSMLLGAVEVIVNVVGLGLIAAHYDWI